MFVSKLCVKKTCVMPRSLVKYAESRSYGAAGSLQRPRRAADAVAVISVVRGQTGGAGGEGRGHGQGPTWSGWLGRVVAVIVHVTF